MPRPPKKFHAHPFEYHEELVLTIESLTNLGDGIARVDLPDQEGEGWVVFVPFTLPGEKVRARIFRNDKNHSRADLIKVIEPSEDRATPGCPLFGACGGCQYQHLAYPAQLAWKTRQVGELLEHMAGIHHSVEPCHPSPQIWGYRSKITPHFAKPRQGVIDAIGFLPNARRSGQMDVPHCPIAMAEINAALPSVREDVRRRAKTYKRGATLLLRAVEGRVETNPNAIATERVGELSFDFLAGDFFQNNPFILPDFTGYAAAEARKGEMRFLVDAYCGSGLFALTLAPHFEQVAGVEVSETSADWARRNALQNGISNATFLTASAEAIFEGIAFPAEKTAVLIDPPRKGCSEEFLAQLIAFGPERVVYVSCNPATQVRDLGRLQEGGYGLEKVQPFDLFPHTRHLECVMTLVKTH
ncbi:23S rRNA (uracil1939-C5)-methyltransferase/tRNA (uracil-5-)-methyltransferase [Haloferula luteola]|uniref:23S rRNA (Uracil1939-C5)-methyltransferase/tRNA (Uracil-5-)-methyltransferase n=1 Tax=Haloferula luteola TaxID=595692 RepID=A0A840V2N6_9BACT|nr:class I SAM-dependent RNA methyltransferase [Haloferula luteola]MBB5351733.1 23S rRNA (uracil1939-C5)-methyltransferase/tRNA (uracil-5-)-methyltransferase [Haloferula luteola]